MLRGLFVLALLVGGVAGANACGGHTGPPIATFASARLQCSFRYPSSFRPGPVQAGVVEGSLKVELTDPGARSRIAVYLQPWRGAPQESPAQALAAMTLIRSKDLGKHLVSFTVSRVVTMNGLRGFVLGDIDTGTASDPSTSEIESEQWVLWNAKDDYTVFLLGPANRWQSEYRSLVMVPESLEPR